MEKQDYAKQLALEYGLRVFPLKPNTKTPLPSMTNFWDKATADESKIEEYWPEGSTNNIGICTTKNAHGNDLLIIDVDSGKGKKGKESFQQLINDGYELPKTFSQDSPNGKHYFLISPREAKNLEAPPPPACSTKSSSIPLNLSSTLTPPSFGPSPILTRYSSQKDTPFATQ